MYSIFPFCYFYMIFLYSIYDLWFSLSIILLYKANITLLFYLTPLYEILRRKWYRISWCQAEKKKEIRFYNFKINLNEQEINFSSFVIKRLCDYTWLIILLALINNRNPSKILGLLGCFCQKFCKYYLIDSYDL